MSFPLRLSFTQQILISLLILTILELSAVALPHTVGEEINQSYSNPQPLGYTQSLLDQVRFSTRNTLQDPLNPDGDRIHPFHVIRAFPNPANTSQVHRFIPLEVISELWIQAVTKFDGIYNRTAPRPIPFGYPVPPPPPPPNAPPLPSPASLVPMYPGDFSFVSDTNTTFPNVTLRWTYNNATPPADPSLAWYLANDCYTSLKSMVYSGEIYGLVEGELWSIRNDTGGPIFKGRLAYETLEVGKAKVNGMPDLPPVPVPDMQVKPWSWISGEGAIGGLPPGVTDEEAEAQTAAVFDQFPGLGTGGIGLWDGRLVGSCARQEFQEDGRDQGWRWVGIQC